MLSLWRLAVEDTLREQLRWDLISDTNNLVYQVTTGSGQRLLAKFYTTKGLHSDNDVNLRSVLPPSAQVYLRDVITAGETPGDRPVRYAVFEYVQGKTLLESPPKGGEVQLIVKEVLRYLWAVTDLPTHNFGYLRETLEGSHSSWLSFLLEYQLPTVSSLLRHPSTRGLATIPYIVVERVSQDLTSPVQSRLCPIDLNLANLLVTPKGRLVVLDPGSVVAGPPEAAYGQFLAEVYGTRLGAALLAGLPAHLRTDQLLGQAALSSLNVLGFIIRNSKRHPANVTPWGNPRTYLDLLQEYLRRLGIRDPAVQPGERERLLHVREAKEPA